MRFTQVSLFKITHSPPFVFHADINVDSIRYVVNHEYRYAILDEWMKPNTWYHVCIVHRGLDSAVDANTSSVYLNGEIIEVHKTELIFSERLVGTGIRVCFQEPEINPNLRFRGLVAGLNLWNRILSGTEIKSFAQCGSLHGGNVIDWAATNWTHRNLIVEKTEPEELCEIRNETTFRILDPMNYEEATYLCEGMSGELWMPKDYRDIWKFNERVSNDGSNGCILYWAGLWEVSLYFRTVLHTIERISWVYVNTQFKTHYNS